MTDSKALVPIEVMPPTTILPQQGDLALMTQIAGQAVLAQGMMPAGIKTKEQAFAVMLAGWELGARPMTALRHMFIINGRTDPDAQLMMGIVKARDPSAQFVWHETTPQAADVELRRQSRAPVRIRYTIEDAKRSGQANKSGPWQQYPADMLRWAVVKRVCRLGAPDLVNAISGVAVDEAGGMMTEAVAEDVTDAAPVIAEPAAQEAAPAEESTIDPGPDAPFLSPAGDLDTNELGGYMKQQQITAEEIGQAIGLPDGKKAGGPSLLKWRLAEPGRTITSLFEKIIAERRSAAADEPQAVGEQQEHPGLGADSP